MRFIIYHRVINPSYNSKSLRIQLVSQNYYNRQRNTSTSCLGSYKKIVVSFLLIKSINRNVRTIASPLRILSYFLESWRHGLYISQCFIAKVLNKLFTANSVMPLKMFSKTHRLIYWLHRGIEPRKSGM